MKKLFFVRSGSTCRMLRILAAAMLLLPVNLQPVRASRQDAGAKSSLTVKMKDATLSSVFAEVERTSRYAFIYTDDVRPLLDRRVSVSVRSATIDELLSAVLKGTELTGRVRENQVIISKAPARKNAAVAPPLPAADSGREIVLQGTVISSADNKPIVGVSVYVEGTTVGATSDINGNYTLKVPAGTKHVTFAFLGYKICNFITYWFTVTYNVYQRAVLNLVSFWYHYITFVIISLNFISYIFLLYF